LRVNGNKRRESIGWKERKKEGTARRRNASAILPASCRFTVKQDLKGVIRVFKKYTKRAFTFMVFLAVVTMLAAAALAAVSEGLQTRAGIYLEGSAIPPSISRDNSVKEITAGSTSPDINVTLIVEAGNEYTASAGKFWVSQDVTVPSPASGDYTVTDLLVAANNIPNPDVLFLDESENPITLTTDYVAAVSHDSIVWMEGEAGVFDGWEFRINDKFPVYANGTGWTGDSILETKIVNGDIVHFFYDLPADFSRTSGIFSSDYVRGIRLSSTSSTASSLTVQLQGHTAYIHPTTIGMYVDNYKNVQAGVTAHLYDATGTTLIDTQVSDVHGQVVFSGAFTSGDYIVITEPVYQPTFRSSIHPEILIALTGAYSMISIP
jgi:hypothetical protein